MKSTSLRTLILLVNLSAQCFAESYSNSCFLTSTVIYNTNSGVSYSGSWSSSSITTNTVSAGVTAVTTTSASTSNSPSIFLQALDSNVRARRATSRYVGFTNDVGVLVDTIEPAAIFQITSNGYLISTGQYIGSDNIKGNALFRKFPSPPLNGPSWAQLRGTISFGNSTFCYNTNRLIYIEFESQLVQNCTSVNLIPQLVNPSISAPSSSGIITTLSMTSSTPTPIFSSSSTISTGQVGSATSASTTTRQMTSSDSTSISTSTSTSTIPSTLQSSSTSALLSMPTTSTTILFTLSSIMPTSSAPNQATTTPTTTGSTTSSIVVSTIISNTTASVQSSTTSTSSSSLPTVYPSKRGLAYTNVNTTRLYPPPTLISWSYNYFSLPNSSNNAGVYPYPSQPIRFIPLLFNSAPSLTSIWASNVNTSLRFYGADAVFSFNEPDFCLSGSSACMSVADAISTYKTYIQPFAGTLRLGAPSVTNTGSGLSYLSQFLSNATQQNLTVDFINIHWYASPYNFDYLATFVTQAYLLGGGSRPVVLSEFGLDSSSYAASAVAAFLKNATTWLDAQPFVERYAWFGNFPGYLLNSDGSGLSDLGRIYNNYTAGYVSGFGN